MQVEILDCLAGAESASGAVVIIDVFRAGNTIAALLSSGAPFVAAVAEMEEALKLKKANPDWLAVGERGGLMPEGFEVNNSPVLAPLALGRPRPAVITTSAGSRGLAAAIDRADLLMASTLVNASSSAALIKKHGPGRVSLVAIGTEAVRPAAEDRAVAEFIFNLLKGKKTDYRETAGKMLSGEGAARLKKLGQHRDLAFCLGLDKLTVIPVAEKTEKGIILRPAET